MEGERKWDDDLEHDHTRSANEFQSAWSVTSIEDLLQVELDWGYSSKASALEMWYKVHALGTGSKWISKRSNNIYVLSLSDIYVPSCFQQKCNIQL